MKCPACLLEVISSEVLISILSYPFLLPAVPADHVEFPLSPLCSSLEVISKWAGTTTCPGHCEGTALGIEQRWMDGRMDRQVDGWTNEWIDGRKKLRWIYGWIYG